MLPKPLAPAINGGNVPAGQVDGADRAGGGGWSAGPSTTPHSGKSAACIGSEPRAHLHRGLSSSFSNHVEQSSITLADQPELDVGDPDGASKIVEQSMNCRSYTFGTPLAEYAAINVRHGDAFHFCKLHLSIRNGRPAWRRGRASARRISPGVRQCGDSWRLRVVQRAVALHARFC